MIQDCDIDVRKEMARSIYLSGGVTMLPGFPERLESEIDNITPSHLIPKVIIRILIDFINFIFYTLFF